MERGSIQGVAESRSLLDRGLGELGIEVTVPQREALLELADLVDRWGARLNLTGHRGLLAVVQGLILGSAALVAQLPEVESLADIGSGAGFPGLPMAVLRPGCRVTLVESRLKRHHFQRAALRSLGLGNVKSVLGRAEDLEPFPHVSALAQAVAPPDSALALLIPWIVSGGLAILPGGPEAPQPAHPRASRQRQIRYRVPCGGPERTLWIAQIT